MADSTITTMTVHPPMEATPGSVELATSPQPGPRRKPPSLNQIYALPAPIRTFPLPSFYPNNPLSLIHLAYMWMKQALSPPSREPSSIHTGTWDAHSRSVHVTDPTAVRALWEQGFYGKGSLSRSEPNWLKREQIRRGAAGGDVSEQRTASRREERRQVKWERARTEQEALEKTRQEEAQLNAASGEIPDTRSFLPALLELQSEPKASVSRLEPHFAPGQSTLAESPLLEAHGILSLDATAKQSEAATEEVGGRSTRTSKELGAILNGAAKASHTRGASATQSATPPLSPVGELDTEVVLPLKATAIYKPPVGPLELLALPNCTAELQRRTNTPSLRESAIHVEETPSSSFPLLQDRLLEEVTLLKKSTNPSELLALPNSLALVQPSPTTPTGGQDLGVNTIKTATNLSVLNCVPAEMPVLKPPVGPLELLALPNSLPTLRVGPNSLNGSTVINGSFGATEPNKRQECRNDGVVAVASQLVGRREGGSCAVRTNSNAHIKGETNGANSVVATTKPLSPVLAPKTPDRVEEQSPKQRKSVRFSTTVESATFSHSEPPSLDRPVPYANCNGAASVECVPSPNDALLVPVGASASDQGKEVRVGAPQRSVENPARLDVASDISNKEHLQLSPEEAFFLAYGIGALSILDPVNKATIPKEKLLEFFRSYSYFPPRTDLQPSDPFLLHYVVYHHFRSLGWVPRHGVKFGVDWMLYQRGPVFDHAEFGVIVMPAYSHSWWKEAGREPPLKTWHWLHGVNRVLSHVLKSLVLVYVDVPPPHVFDSVMASGGISAALKEYRVREFMIRRWSSNRNR